MTSEKIARRIEDLGPIVRTLGYIHNGMDQGWLLCHSIAKATGMANFQSCCRIRRAGINHAPPDSIVTCLWCLRCRGCVACKDNMITPETTAMGQWTTAKKHLLWPFEMDDQHLINAINKLHRDKEHFKRNWRKWVECLESEALLRTLL